MNWTWQRVRDALWTLELPDGQYCAGVTGLLLADGTMRGAVVVEVLVTPRAYADLSARGWRPMEAGLESPTDPGLVAVDPEGENTLNVPDAIARATEVDGVPVMPADLVPAEARRAVVAMNLILDGSGIDIHGNRVVRPEPEREVYGGTGPMDSNIISPESQQALLAGLSANPDVRRQLRLVTIAFVGFLLLIGLGFFLFMASRLGGVAHLTFQTDEVQGTLLSAEDVGRCRSDNDSDYDDNKKWRLEYEWEADGETHRDTIDTCTEAFEIGETESIWVQGDDVKSTNSPGATWAVGLGIVGLLAGGTWFARWRKRRKASQER